MPQLKVVCIFSSAGARTPVPATKVFCSQYGQDARELHHQQFTVGHIIAAGGAGSLGSPAAVRGRTIINTAKSAITTIPTAYKGCSNIFAEVICAAHIAAECSQPC